MEKIVLVFFLSLSLIFASCGGSENTEKKKTPKEQIAKFDTDKDNKISLEEWLFSRKIEFSQFDKDKDDIIKKREMKSKKKPGSGRRFRKIDANDDNRITLQEWLEPTENSFKIKDNNQDGFITEDELKGNRPVRKRTAKFDTDKDNKASFEEWLSFQKVSFSAFDKDKDGFIQKNEMPSKNKPGGDRKFKKIDADDNNQITMQEWLAFNENKFKKRDSNQDGYLTEDELNPKTSKKKE
jgi:Ca2+-binding EF-hand superfamily protein